MPIEKHDRAAPHQQPAGIKSAAAAADSTVDELTRALREHRKAAGLTQAQLATKLGYSR
jgi:ribosome-binding protein aMBF1 (putative translation factor)